MSAIGDLMRALMPFAKEGDRFGDALRKHAPCVDCGGCGRVFGAMGPGDDVLTCGLCSGAGWTPGSVEAAIARSEEQERALAAGASVLVAAEREACAQIAEQCSGGDHEFSKRDLIAGRIRARK